MIKFLKNFGLGVVYMLLLPLFLLAIAIFMVYGLIMWFVAGVKAIISFFKAKDIFPPFEEDAQVDKIRQAQLDSLASPQPQTQTPIAPNTTNSTVYVQQNYYNQRQQQPPEPNSQPNQMPSQAPYQNNPYETQGNWVEPQPQIDGFLGQSQDLNPTPGLPRATTLLENNSTIELDEEEDEI